MTKDITIRNEKPCDLDTITRLTESAFESESHSTHTEQFIVKALRRADQLPISLLAIVDDAIVGHVAISPVTISSGLGCVLLGDPAFYGRFGFKAHPGLVLDGVPPEYFQVVSFGSEIPSGTVRYHEAFNASS
ncbi:hypothetical protein BGZ95_007354 [Linnemannia exigua]|uniref:Acetyltransferase n=1 Tax=Linnemannia exigua TaxID=604196 RepID=A0AAD4GZF8_9FUNG|nr:hypothetical protein BGZ95_007354 [Linnemannia exigua]